jgi:glycine/D-amino acid oxidase-like deaminating enzyme
MPSHHTRISIIGCGHVGTSCAYAILQNHLVWRRQFLHLSLRRGGPIAKVAMARKVAVRLY